LTPNVDPRDSHVILSKSADTSLEALAVCPEAATHQSRCRAIIDAAYAGEITPIGGFQEINFLADAVIRGERVVLLCTQFAGCPRGDRRFSTIVRGVFKPDRAEALKALGKGLAPFINELRSPLGARKVANERHDRTS
jgi:hypothetical protein